MGLLVNWATLPMSGAFYDIGNCDSIEPRIRNCVSVKLLRRIFLFIPKPDINMDLGITVHIVILIFFIIADKGSGQI